MKSICIRIEDDLHKRLKMVVFLRDETITNHLLDLIERDVETCENASSCAQLSNQAEVDSE